VGFVEPAQLNEWAKETEIESGKGAARLGGKWSVVLATVDNQRDALMVYDEVRRAGYPAEIRPSKDADKRSYVVRIRGLTSKQEAEALAAQLRGKHGVAEPRAGG
jgi:cell division septation protein DedD